MKFSIKQESLKEELGFVQGITEKRSTLPVLSCILIESEGKNKVKITGTDLDTTLITAVEAEVDEEGVACVSARKLFDIVRLLEPGKIYFSHTGGRVEVESGRSNFKLLSYNEESFPEIPSPPSLDIEIENYILSSFINLTSFAITQETSRYVLTGAKFELRRGMLRMVTTDTHRLAFVESKAEGREFDVLVPRKAINELAKLTREEGVCRFGERENLLYFQAGERMMVTRKLMGTFPNYEMVIPKESLFVAEFDSVEIKNALRRVSLMADERSKAVKLTLSEGRLKVEAESSEEGMAVEEISASYSGETTTIGFNFQYLQDFLNAVSAEGAAAVEKEIEADKVKVREDSTKVKFEFSDKNSQVVMKPSKEGNYRYLYVVMPLRI